VEENGDILICDGPPPGFRQLEFNYNLRDVPARFVDDRGGEERGIIHWLIWTHESLHDRSHPEAWMVQILLFAFYRE
jgi:hypothetical protein